MIIGLLPLKFHILFDQFGYDVGIYTLLFIPVVLSIIRFISIIPGNIGVRESLVGAVTFTNDLSFETGFIPTIAERLIELVLILFFGGIFLFIYPIRE